MKVPVRTLVFFAFLTIPNFALASVQIDFESLAAGGSGVVEVGPFYPEDGFEIRNLEDSHPRALLSAQTGNTTQYAGSAALFNHDLNGTTQLRRAGGGVFELNSIDLSEGRDGFLGPTNVAFIGTKSDLSTVTQSIDLDGVFGFETLIFLPSFTDLISVEWDQTPQFHQFDNIVLDATATAAVPEPTTFVVWALLGLTTSGIAYRRKRVA